MKEFIRFSLPSGHVFELNARVVADDRAACYHKHNPDEFKTLDEAREDTIGLFDDDFEVYDWLANNMDIDEVMAKHGRLVAFKPHALAWHEADRTHTDERAAVEPVSGDDIMSVPVEMVISQMAGNGELCNVTLMNNPETGQPQSAMVFIHGGPAVVDTFIQGLQAITNHIASREQRAADAAQATGHQH